MRRTLPLLVVLVPVLASCRSDPAGPPSRALRSGDALAVTVVLPPDAPPALQMAADDLVDVMCRRAGVPASVTPQVAGNPGFDPAGAPTDIVILAGTRPIGAEPLAPVADLAAGGPRGGQGFAIAEEIRDGRLVVRVESPTPLGTAYGLYGIADRLGALWYHPDESFVPLDPAATLPDLGAPAVDAPAMDLRGYHQHTQHPTPMSDWLLVPDEAHRAPLTGYFRWLLRNRQNGFQWHMLATVDLAKWRDHGRWVVEEAHRHGVRAGMVVAFADKQQNGFRLIADLGDALAGEARLEHQRRQLRAGLDALWALALGLDHLHVSFATSEMTTVADAEVLGWFDELAAWAEARTDAPELFAHLHIPGGLVAEDGETLFYHLPLRASPTVGLFVHTTMFYDLEHPAPVYGNRDFHHARKPFLEGKGDRKLVYFPETAWWLGFDNNLPLFLPITGWTRSFDLATVLPSLMGDTRLDGHVTFTTGIEWNYWMYDHFLARATWRPAYAWDQYVADASRLYGPAAGAVATALRTVTDLQVAAFLGDNPLIFFYLAGESSNDELGAPSGLVGRPVKVPFWSVYHLDDDGFAAWKARDFDPLTALRDAFVDAADALGRADPGAGAGTPEDAAVARRFLEIRSSMDLLAWRARHSVLLYGAVVDARAGAEAAAYDKLAAARAITAAVKARVAEVETEVYRCPLALCASEKPDSLTAYPFGDLWETRTAHFWERRDEQLQALLDVAFGRVQEGFDPGYDTVYATDATATALTEPDVDEGVKGLLTAYVPAMLLAVGAPGAAGVPLALGEDLNGNGRPDPGTIVSGISAPGVEPWTFDFAVLPLSIGDSAAPLGTLNLRTGRATVTLDAGVPTLLEIACRVDFQDLLDALEATGMFDQATGWEMVAPLFGIDPAAEPRPTDFPMRFAAPLSPAA